MFVCLTIMSFKNHRNIYFCGTHKVSEIQTIQVLHIRLNFLSNFGLIRYFFHFIKKSKIHFCININTISEIKTTIRRKLTKKKNQI